MVSLTGIQPRFDQAGLADVVQSVNLFFNPVDPPILATKVLETPDVTELWILRLAANSGVGFLVENMLRQEEPDLGALVRPEIRFVLSSDTGMSSRPFPVVSIRPAHEMLRLNVERALGPDPDDEALSTFFSPAFAQSPLVDVCHRQEITHLFVARADRWSECGYTGLNGTRICSVSRAGNLDLKLPIWFQLETDTIRIPISR